MCELCGLVRIHCRQEAAMIFAQHPSGSFVDAARSVEGVLILGRIGQGVGLLGDLLLAAATENGLPACRDELPDNPSLHPYAAVRPGASDVPQDASEFEIVGAA